MRCTLLLMLDYQVSACAHPAAATPLPKPSSETPSTLLPPCGPKLPGSELFLSFPQHFLFVFK